MPLRKKLPAQEAVSPTLPAAPRRPAPRRPIGKGSVDEAGLNPQQRRFVQHYLLCLNGTQAALRAGYAPSTATVQGSRLLTHDKVAAEIKREQQATANKLNLTKEMVVAELAKLGFSNMQDYMRPGADGEPVLDFSQLTRDQAAALQEVTVEEFKDGRSDKREVRRTKFKLAAKKDALELLGKHLGMFKDELTVKHDHQHTILGTILLEIDAEARAKTIEHKADETPKRPDVENEEK